MGLPKDSSLEVRRIKCPSFGGHSGHIALARFTCPDGDTLGQPIRN